MDIREAGTHPRSLEAGRLRHDPARHVAAIAPAHDRKLLRIGHPSLADLVDTSHDVAVVAAAPVGDVAAHEFLAIVAAATRVWIKDRPAAPSPQLSAVMDAQLEPIGVRARRTA